MTIDEALDVAINLHQNGQLNEAMQAYRIVLDAQPENFNALHLLGVALHQAGHSAEAVPLIRKALTINPQSSDAYNNLAAVLVESDRFQEGLIAADNALRLDDQQLDSYLHQARARFGMNQIAPAIQTLGRLLTLCPDHGPGQELLATLESAAAASAPMEGACEYEIIASRPLRPIRIVSLTRGRFVDTLLYQSLVQLQHDHYHAIEHNRSGIPAIYNRYLAQYAGSDEILVFIHDDVAIWDLFFREKLNAAVAHFGLVGVVGASEFVDPGDGSVGWFSSPNAHFSGGVYHTKPDGHGRWSDYGRFPAACVTLDGLMLAIDCRKIGNLRFDEQYSFHFYDLDFCLQANMASIGVGTWPIALAHQSGGNYTTDSYLEARTIFLKKWRGIVSPLSVRVD